MKVECRNKSAIGMALFAWLTFAPLAQAYYNPSAGRWLNRDPIEERGGKALYAAVGNQMPCKADFRGLVELNLTERTGSVPGYFGVTEFTIPTDVGCSFQVVGCNLGLCRKITSVSCRANITITYATGHDPDNLMAGYSYTTREHERRHADNGLAYANHDEAVLNGVKERCVSRGCMSALLDYVAAERRFALLTMETADEFIHVFDLPHESIDYQFAVSNLASLGQLAWQAAAALEAAADRRAKACGF